MSNRKNIGRMKGIAWIADYYNLPSLKIGTRLTFRGQPGQVTGSSLPYLRIRLDGETKPKLIHPTWEVKYEEVDSEQTQT